MPQMDLNSLFQSDPAAQELGLGFLGQEKQLNQANLAQKAFELQKGQAMLPLDMASKKANTTQTETQTKGMVIENQFNTQNMRTKLMQQYESLRKSMTDNDYKEIEDAANAYTQGGELLAQLPGVATHAAARQVLGKFYRPEFDQIPPQALGHVISNFGQSMQQMKMTDPNIQSKFILGNQKAETERYKADVAAQSKRDVANTVAQTKIKQIDNELRLIQEKAKLGGYAQQSGYYSNAAQEAAVQAAQTEDEGLKQQLLARAKVFAQIAEDAKNQEIQKAVAAAIEANRKAIDPNAIGQGQIRSVTPPGKTGQGTKENPIKLD